MADKQWIVRRAIESLLQLSNEDTQLAQEIASALASLDWQQALLNLHQKEIDSQMRAMKSFYEWRERGGEFCDDCDHVNYVGGYHHGPQYEHVYAWPHSFPPSHFSSTDATSGKRYCWKCFHKTQESTKYMHIQLYRDKHHNTQGIFYLKNEMTRCKVCGRLFPERAGYRFGYDLYCIHCIEYGIEKQFTFCKGCNKKIASSTNGYCHDCYPISQQLGSTISFHLSRAIKAGTPATLTLLQWNETLKYFHKKCAYCQSRPYQVLEHFLPLVRGGGTTVDNCVPSCQKCNSKKGGSHPDHFNTIFPKHIIDHIKAYFENSKSEIEPITIHGRELIVKI